MIDTYKALAGFAQTWGLLYFVGLFLIVVAYALSPSRKARFEEAAHTPLRED
ncbi:cbb3-type cytochrome c oxidase subunit 3 [Chelatococcus sp. SYSU_G07232]|uniref:Cbb3-type cytochrome c oxidase subunit 3 n=1 Tax=Chelatococcus albus TaxID=3047466 RepID=A0ABT7AF90_9HYPH|nr:cbb3-type cytochrome c oxidase subunit 3 [Chelatococcus sp. SYSU_G07232]MDJ1158030.1 cbb3-type cytochrome c oxidase subunit 3 [Chelatococcus sp. SYSU_G07232]